MHLSNRALLLSASVALSALGTARAASSQTEALAPLPATTLSEMPAANSPPDTPSTRPQAAPSPQQLYQHVRRGIVTVERTGIPLAIGTVLDGDGRVLTSFSGLGGAEKAELRYADGTTTHAKVGSVDKSSDLALLVPEAQGRTEGLAASEADPVGAPLRAMLPVHGANLGPAEARVRGRVDAHTRDGAPLAQMLDVDVKGSLVAGAPLLDAAGAVVGLLVHACKGAVAPRPEPVPWAEWGAPQPEGGSTVQAPCTPVIIGAPVSSIRAFLAQAPPSAPPAAWLGIRGEPAQAGPVRGVRVLAVAPASPAQGAGLAPGSDLIVAANGRPIESPESLAEAIAQHAPGETVTFLVFGGREFREVAVVLHAAP